MFAAGLSLFVTGLLMVTLIMTLGSTRYPLAEGEYYSGKVFPGYDCIVYNATHARCQQCVVANATLNTRNCTTCSVPFAATQNFTNCTSVVTNGTVPIESVSMSAAGSRMPRPQPTVTASSPKAASVNATTTTTTTVTVTKPVQPATTAATPSSAEPQPGATVIVPDNTAQPLVE